MSDSSVLYAAVRPSRLSLSGIGDPDGHSNNVLARERISPRFLQGGYVGCPHCQQQQQPLARCAVHPPTRKQWSRGCCRTHTFTQITLQPHHKLYQRTDSLVHEQRDLRNSAHLSSLRLRPCHAIIPFSYLSKANLQLQCFPRNTLCGVAQHLVGDAVRRWAVPNDSASCDCFAWLSDRSAQFHSMLTCTRSFTSRLPQDRFFSVSQCT